MKKLIIGLLVVGFALAACSSTKEEQTGPLDGSWALSGASDDDTNDLLSGAGITLTLAGGEGSGFSGCNTYSLAYVAAGESGKFVVSDAISTTKKACVDENQMLAERTFLGLLSTTTTYALEGRNLTLSHPDGFITFVSQ